MTTLERNRIALERRLVGPTFLGEPHCVYCGTALFWGFRCPAHDDLEDDSFEEWHTARRMREWWLANYSTDEIVELASAFEEVLAAA